LAICQDKIYIQDMKKCLNENLNADREQLAVPWIKKSATKDETQFYLPNLPIQNDSDRNVNKVEGKINRV
jgi:hypothetical protein